MSVNLLNPVSQSNRNYQTMMNFQQRAKEVAYREWNKWQAKNPQRLTAEEARALEISDCSKKQKWTNFCVSSLLATGVIVGSALTNSSDETQINLGKVMVWTSVAGFVSQIGYCFKRCCVSPSTQKSSDIV